MKNITNNWKTYLILFAMLAFTWIVFAQTTPPERINYQGVLRDSSDKPLNGNVTMTFRFYDDPSAGTLLWEEIYDDVVYPPEITVSDGLFTVALGDLSHRSGGSEANFVDIFKNYTDVYLAVKVETDLEMTPRIKVISAGYALNADLLDGYHSIFFLDASSMAQTKSAQLTLDASSAVIGYGVEGRGPEAGGYFIDSNSSGYAFVGYSDRGINAFGNEMGGYFKDSDGTGYAYVGWGNSGIRCFGEGNGGYFEDTNSSGYAYAAFGHYGIQGYGNTAGGYFKDADNSGYAYVGNGDEGIHALGNSAGGYFKDADGTGYAYVGYGAYGISAYGSGYGGYFEDTDGSGYASVGSGHVGVSAYGDFAGGTFQDSSSGKYCWAGYDTYKTYGNGTNAFVQNHPHDDEKVIVYNSPEGDEAATYTRGTAKLINGEAHVPLGETFRWVTNPDIGLTAYVTPIGQWADLYVASKKTDELIIRSHDPEATGVEFDYIVYGLRIGFEEVSIVQDKKEESWIPSMKDHRDLYVSHPELRQYNAFERFKKMRLTTGKTEILDLTASFALKNAIEEYDPEIHVPVGRERPELERPIKPDLETESQPQAPISAEGMIGEQMASSETVGYKTQSTFGTIPVDEEGNIHAKSFRSISPDLTGNVPISEQVEVGDVLVVDPMNPGMMRLGDQAADSAVIGVVAGEPGVVLGSMKQIEEAKPVSERQLKEESPIQEGLEIELPQTHAPVALSGIVQCKVDAGYGSIQIGDLLTTSATRGHAMRSDDHAAGTIIGKALEPLDAGTGLIKVLVMMR